MLFQSLVCMQVLCRAAGLVCRHFLEFGQAHFIGIKCLADFCLQVCDTAGSASFCLADKFGAGW